MAIRNLFERMVLVVGFVVVLSAVIVGQEPGSPTTEPTPVPAAATRPRTSAKSSGDEKKSTDLNLPADVPFDTQVNRREVPSEDAAAIEPYYNNFFLTYRLGPEDVISVYVFGQERYSRANVTIPPNGRISLPLIPEGVFVNGKTVEEVAEMIRKKYDEYIIDPKVDVSLDKAMSYRYSVIGDVAQPGIKLMSRRLTVREALAEAGGILPTGDKKKVTLLRRGPNGTLSAIRVNISAMERGQMQDTAYLAPGDQIVVPGNTLKKIQSILSLFQIVNFARIFTGGF